MKEQGQGFREMSWAKFNSVKEKSAPKNVCAVTKEARAQECECMKGRKGAERLSLGSGTD